MERVSTNDWRTALGHIERYEYAAMKTHAGEIVNDIACGVGYGATFFASRGSHYHGYDREDVPNLDFPGKFHVANLDDPLWEPETLADVSVCFETLEHVKDPIHLAAVLSQFTNRAVIVSVPVVPTKHMNPWHLHDFTVDDVPLMFPNFTVQESWPQPNEFSHVWLLEHV